jgi:hypothetical protein
MRRPFSRVYQGRPGRARQTRERNKSVSDVTLTYALSRNEKGLALDYRLCGDSETSDCAIAWKMTELELQLY